MAWPLKHSIQRSIFGITLSLTTPQSLILSTNLWGMRRCSQTMISQTFPKQLGLPHSDALRCIFPDSRQYIGLQLSSACASKTGRIKPTELGFYLALVNSTGLFHAAQSFCLLIEKTLLKITGTSLLARSSLITS